MSTTEFPGPGPGAGVNSQLELNRAQLLVLRNSRFLIGVTLTGSLFAAFLGICMVLPVFPLLFPLRALTVAKGFSAVQWAASALAMTYMFAQLWSLGRKMAGRTRSGWIAGAWSSTWAQRRFLRICFYLGIRSPPSSRSVSLTLNNISSRERTEAGPYSRPTHFSAPTK
jgi:hypothetical protein